MFIEDFKNILLFFTLFYFTIILQNVNIRNASEFYDRVCASYHYLYISMESIQRRDGSIISPPEQQQQQQQAACSVQTLSRRMEQQKRLQEHRELSAVGSVRVPPLLQRGRKRASEHRGGLESLESRSFDLPRRCPEIYFFLAGSCNVLREAQVGGKRDTESLLVSVRRMMMICLSGVKAASHLPAAGSQTERGEIDSINKTGALSN